MNEGWEKLSGIAWKFRWHLWLVFLVGWTTALLMSFPGDSPLVDIDIDLKYFLAKTLHITAYGCFAGLSGWLRLPARFRWILVLFLTAHGVATELLQQLVPGRTGCLEDVGFDMIGIVLGCLLTWRWWCDPS